MTMRANGFSANTRREIAARAGHRCSFRGCERSTSGPSRNPAQQSLENGWACHIYPAGTAGPRSELSPDDVQLSDIQNAIWMCETHGTLIDKNNGLDYPPRLLQKWRDNAEDAAAAAQTSGFSRPPSIECVRVEKSSDGKQLFEFAEIQIELFAFTVVYAKHDRVLSMICTSLTKALEFPGAAISNLAGNELTFQVDFSARHRAPSRVSFNSGRVRYWDGDMSVSSIEGFYEAVLVDKTSLATGFTSERAWTANGDDEVNEHRESLIPKDPLLTERLAERIKDEDNVMVEDIRLSGGHWDVRCRGHKPDQYFGLGSLSSSEQMSVHLDLTLSLIRTRARSSPTVPFLLVVDNVLWCYDDTNLARFVAICGRLPRNIQVLVTDATGRVSTILSRFRQDLRVENRVAPAGYLVTQGSFAPG